MWRFRKPSANTIAGFTAPPATPPNDAARQVTRPSKGVVLWFDRERGFGRIRSAEGCGTIIVHQSAVARSGLIGLFPGQEVEFRPVLWAGRHVRADNLRLIAAFTE
jgi:cold shock CspA family protein